MDKYFIFVDENVIQGVLVFTTGVILSIVVALLCEKYFHFKYGGFFIVLWILTRSCVGQHIANEDKRLFINSRINSIITELILEFTTGVILSIVVALLCEKYFHFKYGGFFIV